jgi:hypothetical protein
VPYDASGDRTEGSVLAQLSQAMELYLLMPVLDLAYETDEFGIVLWQHDGMNVAFKNQGRKDRWMRKIQTAVNRRAAELSIPTRLEVAYDAS